MAQQPLKKYEELRANLYDVWVLLERIQHQVESLAKHAVPDEEYHELKTLLPKISNSIESFRVFPKIVDRAEAANIKRAEAEKVKARNYGP